MRFLKRMKPSANAGMTRRYLNGRRISPNCGSSTQQRRRRLKSCARTSPVGMRSVGHRMEPDSRTARRRRQRRTKTSPILNQADVTPLNIEWLRKEKLELSQWNETALQLDR